jgi:hypothetical protein
MSGNLRHRGRFQAQGIDINRNSNPTAVIRGNEGTVSIRWNQSTPLSLREAHSLLSSLHNLLTYEQRGVRAKAFTMASRFMSRTGGVDATNPNDAFKSFPRDGPDGPREVARLPHPSIRVDVEVNAGRAFVP